VNVFAEKGPDSYEPMATIPTKMSARTMTIDPKTGELFLVAADMKVNEAAQPSDFRQRFTIVPGSTQLLMLIPTRCTGSSGKDPCLAFVHSTPKGNSLPNQFSHRSPRAKQK
jgi:hypothetical protein